MKRLTKKYKSLPRDIAIFERVLEQNPTGIGASFAIIRANESVQIVKARLACRTLRAKSLRIIYAYHKNINTFTYLEIYFKGDKENEDRARIEEYLKDCQA